MRLLADALRCQREFIKPLLATLPADATIRYHLGNHEDWIDDLFDVEPALEGLWDWHAQLGLPAKTDVIAQGKVSRLGKVWFGHGDTVRGGEHCAKAAVQYYNRNFRFGHHHTYQTFTSTSAIDNELPMTATAVPCLCHMDPCYGEGKPNRWAQGFLYGYVGDGGLFWDAVAVIINGRTAVNGKLYKG